MLQKLIYSHKTYFTHILEREENNSLYQKRKGKLLNVTMIYFHVLERSNFAENVIRTNLIEALLSSLVKAINYMKTTNRKSQMTTKNTSRLFCC